MQNKKQKGEIIYHLCTRMNNLKFGKYCGTIIGNSGLFGSTCNLKHFKDTSIYKKKAAKQKKQTILSIPLGPSDVLTISAMPKHVKIIINTV